MRAIGRCLEVPVFVAVSALTSCVEYEQRVVDDEGVACLFALPREPMADVEVSEQQQVYAVGAHVEVEVFLDCVAHLHEIESSECAASVVGATVEITSVLHYEARIPPNDGDAVCGGATITCDGWELDEGALQVRYGDDVADLEVPSQVSTLCVPD